jgi:hypothetical protein
MIIGPGDKSIRRWRCVVGRAIARVLAVAVAVALVGGAVWLTLDYRQRHQRAVDIQNAILDRAERYVVAYGDYDAADERAWRTRLRAAGATDTLAAEVSPPQGPAGVDGRPGLLLLRCDHLEYPALCDVTFQVRLGGRPVLAKVNVSAPRAGVVQVLHGPQFAAIESSPAPGGTGSSGAGPSASGGPAVSPSGR